MDGPRNRQPGADRQLGGAWAASRIENRQLADRTEIRGLDMHPDAARRRKSGGTSSRRCSPPCPTDSMKFRIPWEHRPQTQQSALRSDFLSLALHDDEPRADLEEHRSTDAPRRWQHRAAGQATLAEAQAAMKNAKDLLAQDAPLQSDLGATLLQLSRAAKSSAHWSTTSNAIRNLCCAANREIRREIPD
jgi:hypothetical protein